MAGSRLCSCIVVALGCVPCLAPFFPARAEEAFQFTRLVAHWSDYDTQDYLAFVDDARPEVVQVGFYGAHFWSLAHTEVHGGYPAHFPVRGLKEQGDWFEELNRKLHARGVKVVGHFNVEFLVGDPDGPEGPRGFFKFYRDLWDEKLLGPRPVENPLDLLERGQDGAPIVATTYGIGGMKEYWACLRNPAWQAVLRAWVDVGIRRGVDGFIINYFYRHNCVCPHCQAGFRGYLAERFSREQLRSRFGIEDLAGHKFSEIVSWHPAAETSPLRLEMLRFSQLSNKKVFDDVFVRHGRSRKPGLIVGQWNHLGNFSQIDGDERCLLPGDIWGREETYLWYSTGGAANFSDLARRVTGEATLQARYIRGAFGGKPFTLGKYEATRIRVAIAELAANGGAPMGFYTNFKDPAARAEIVRYYRFLAENDALFRGSRPHAEATLLFPRTAIQRGEAGAVERFRAVGELLLDEHVLFDVLPDDLPPSGPGGGLLSVAQPREPAQVLLELPRERSKFSCPYTVRASASRPAKDQREIDLHLVNYDRTEPPPGADGRPGTGSGIADERPRAVRDSALDLLLPSGAVPSRVLFLTPEANAEREVPFAVKGRHVHVDLPEFLVYAVLRVLLD